MPAFNQIGYVVDDIDEAVRYWIDVIGVAPFFLYRDFALAECYHQGEAIDLVISVAYGQAGDVQVELVQQVSDTPSPYVGVPSGQAHHVAIWTSEYDRDVEAYRARGLVDLTWGSASGKPDERFVYFSPAGPGPMLEVVEVLAPKVEMYRKIADAARDYDGTNPVREASLSPSQHVQIRHARPSDYGRVIGVINTWWDGRDMAPMLPKLFFVHFEGTSFVAEDEHGRLIGFVCGFLSQTHDDEAYVHFVGVDPDFRGAGIARALYERFFAAARDAGRSVVRCVTSPSNARSVEFHTRLGFEVERVDENYDGQGESRVLMRVAI